MFHVRRSGTAANATPQSAETPQQDVQNGCSCIDCPGLALVEWTCCPFSDVVSKTQLTHSSEGGGAREGGAVFLSYQWLA